MWSLRTFIQAAGVVLFALATTSCGGGGGGGDAPIQSNADEFSEQGTNGIRVQMGLSSSKVDTGSAFRVDFIFSEFGPFHQIVKVRYPSGLRYIPRTIFTSLDSGPFYGEQFEVQEYVTDEASYLVWYISATDTQKGVRPDGKIERFKRIDVEIALLAEQPTEGAIEIDIDPSYARDFDISNPKFTARQQIYIQAVED